MSGAKNAALPILAAALLPTGASTLRSNRSYPTGRSSDSSVTFDRARSGMGRPLRSVTTNGTITYPTDTVACVRWGSCETVAGRTVTVGAVGIGG